MPLIRLKGSRHGDQVFPEAPLKKLLVHSGGMDGSDALDAVQRLQRGKSVDVFFDLGEDEAASAFMKNAEVLGLEAAFQPDAPVSWLGSRPRPLFLKLSLAVALGLVPCLWLFFTRPGAPVTHLAEVAEAMLFAAWFFYPAYRDRKQKTAVARKRERNIRLWGQVGLLVLVALIGTIVAEPVLGLILLALAFLGIGFAFLIRRMNRE